MRAPPRRWRAPARARRRRRADAAAPARRRALVAVAGSPRPCWRCVALVVLVLVLLAGARAAAVRGPTRLPGDVQRPRRARRRRRHRPHPRPGRDGARRQPVRRPARHRRARTSRPPTGRRGAASKAPGIATSGGLRDRRRRAALVHGRRRPAADRPRPARLPLAQPVRLARPVPGRRHRRARSRAAGSTSTTGAAARTQLAWGHRDRPASAAARSPRRPRRRRRRARQRGLRDAPASSRGRRADRAARARPARPRPEHRRLPAARRSATPGAPGLRPTSGATPACRSPSTPGRATRTTGRSRDGPAVQASRPAARGRDAAGRVGADVRHQPAPPAAPRTSTSSTASCPTVASWSPAATRTARRVTRYGPCRLRRADPARLTGPGCDRRPIYGIAMPTQPSRRLMRPARCSRSPSLAAIAAAHRARRQRSTRRAAAPAARDRRTATPAPTRTPAPPRARPRRDRPPGPRHAARAARARPAPSTRRPLLTQLPLERAGVQDRHRRPGRRRPHDACSRSTRAARSRAHARAVYRRALRRAGDTGRRLRSLEWAR